MTNALNLEIEPIQPDGSEVPRRLLIIRGINVLLDDKGHWSADAIAEAFRWSDLRTDENGELTYWPEVVIVDPYYTAKMYTSLPGYREAWETFLAPYAQSKLRLELWHAFDERERDVFNEDGITTVLIKVYARPFHYFQQMVDSEPSREILLRSRSNFGFSYSWTGVHAFDKTIEQRLTDGDVHYRTDADEDGHNDAHEIYLLNRSTQASPELTARAFTVVKRSDQMRRQPEFFVVITDQP